MPTATVEAPVAPAAPAEVPVPSVPIEPTTPMKVSEAIRLGCLVTKPIRGKMFAENSSGQYACAVGAALIGSGEGGAIIR